MRALVAGGAGFLGSHLCDRLEAEGVEVLVADSFITGRNLPAHRICIQGDISDGIASPVQLDYVINMASPASPPDYLAAPIETLRAGSVGTLNLLNLAGDHGAAFLQASTSEVYGDPLEHPQTEGYWGNVNPIGVRSVYDEGKRFGEAAVMAYHRKFGMPVRIVRIFNTFGPRMRRDDGRAVPQFIEQSLAGQPITVHGDGKQTRTLCYVDDMIEGIWLMLNQGNPGPVNLGGDLEISVQALAELIRAITGSKSKIVREWADEDDPQQRKPDTSLARDLLGWTPRTSLALGLEKTIESWGKE